MLKESQEELGKLRARNKILTEQLKAQHMPKPSSCRKPPDMDSVAENPSAQQENVNVGTEVAPGGFPAILLHVRQLEKEKMWLHKELEKRDTLLKFIIWECLAPEVCYCYSGHVIYGCIIYNRRMLSC